MPKFIFNLTSGQMERLRNYSDNTGIPMAQHLRWYVDNLPEDRIPCGVVISGSIISGFVFVIGGK